MARITEYSCIPVFRDFLCIFHYNVDHPQDFPLTIVDTRTMLLHRHYMHEVMEYKNTQAETIATTLNHPHHCHSHPAQVQPKGV